MKDKKWEEISDRLMVIERKLDNFFSERLKEISETSKEPLKPFDYDDAWKSWESEPEKIFVDPFSIDLTKEGPSVVYKTKKEIEKWNKNEIKKRNILAKETLDNGYKLHYINKDETEIKELFAEWGLWSLVEDISDDGDGQGDNLQLTKEGKEAHRMIKELLKENEVMGIDKLFEEYKKLHDIELSKLNKKKNETINES